MGELDWINGALETTHSERKQENETRQEQKDVCNALTELRLRKHTLPEREDTVKHAKQMSFTRRIPSLRPVAVWEPRPKSAAARRARVGEGCGAPPFQRNSAPGSRRCRGAR